MRRRKIRIVKIIIIISVAIISITWGGGQETWLTVMERKLERK
jgi:hypothetical protein